MTILMRRIGLRLGLGAAAFIPLVVVAAPEITRPPEAVSVATGQNATFTAAASGTGALSYQWLRRGFPIAGATDATFVISRATSADADMYSVVATDSTGSTTSTAAWLAVAPQAYPTDIATDLSYDASFHSHEVFVQALLATPDGGFFAAGKFSRVGARKQTLLARFDAQGMMTSFQPDIVGGAIRAMILQPDGKLIVVGDLSRVGLHRVNGVARFNVDGSFDASYQPFSSATADPTALAVQPDGKVLIGTWLDSQVRRFNEDGSVDDSFTRIVASANAIAVQPDGKIVVGGLLNGTAGTHAVKNIARYHADGTIDETFQPPPLSMVVTGLLVARDGSVYIGSPGNGAQSGLIKLGPTGAQVTNFTVSVSGTVVNLREQDDGGILIAGSIFGVNGVVMAQPDRVRPNGVVDPFVSLYEPMTVGSLAVLNDGGVVVGGDRPGQGGSRRGLIRYSSTGVMQAQPNVDMLAPAAISATARLASGKFIVFGRIEAAGATTTKNIGRLNADGSVDATFASVGTVNQFYPDVVAARGLPDGRIVVGGTFQTGSTLSRPVAILSPTGQPDPSFLVGSTTLTSASTIDLLPSGKVVVGGANVDSTGRSKGGVMVFNLDGSADSTFAGAAPFDNPVTKVIAMTDGSVWAAGWFSKFNDAPVSALVRLMPTGALDTAFPAPAYDVVSDLVRAPDGSVYVLGSTVDASLSSNRLSRLNADGTLDLTFRAPSLGLYSALLPQHDGKLIVRVDPYGAAGEPTLVRLNRDGSLDSTFRAVGVFPMHGVAPHPPVMLDDGTLFFVEGNSSILRFRRSAAVSPPVIGGLNSAYTGTVGGNVVLAASVTSLLPTTYQWRRDGNPIAGATSAAYAIPSFDGSHAGTYELVVTTALGSTMSGPVVVSGPPDHSGHLVNLSVRANSGTGSGRLIVGAVVGGTGTGGNKALLFRAAGPTLATFSVPGAHPDPMLEIYDQNQVKVDQNDDWRGVYDFRTLGAFPFAGEQPKDAAIYNPFVTNGAQTMHIVGKGDTGGVVLAEIYDATPHAVFSTITPRIINGSARTLVGAGADALILGFVIGGESNQRVLVRAAGPTLGAAPYNLPDVLTDPRLEIFDANDVKIAGNDDWGAEGNAASLASAFESVYAFPFASSASKDAAIVLDLPPGRYTAVVRGVNDTTGVALVELYDLP